MRQFLDRLSYLSFLHVTSGYVLANLFLIQSSKKDFMMVRGAQMISSGGEGEADGILGLLVTPVCPRPLPPASGSTSRNQGLQGIPDPLPIKRQL